MSTWDGHRRRDAGAEAHGPRPLASMDSERRFREIKLSGHRGLAIVHLSPRQKKNRFAAGIVEVL
jgi:hypothetical protein